MPAPPESRFVRDKTADPPVPYVVGRLEAGRLRVGDRLAVDGDLTRVVYALELEDLDTSPSGATRELIDAGDSGVRVRVTVGDPTLAWSGDALTGFSLDQVRSELLQLRRSEELAAQRDREALLLRTLLEESDTAMDLLAREQPALLLPVRVETRFDLHETDPALLVRVYPDAIHIDTHERALTDTEQAAAISYWEAVFRAGEDPARRAVADTAFVDAVGPRRAGWIADRTRPTNLNQQPTKPVADEASLPEAPQLPAVAGRGESQTRPPQARALPDRWAAIATLDDVTYRHFGNPIPDRLAAGPGPELGPHPADSHDWLSDFAAAEKMGMALRMPLDPDAASRGFDQLLVVGVRTAATPQASKEELEEVLTAHRHTSGLDLPAPASPTTAPPSPTQPHLDAADKPVEGGRAAQLAAALGISADALAGLDGGDDPLDETARAMNIALWRVTWGDYLDQHLADPFRGYLPKPEDVEAMLRAVSKVRRHARDHLRPGGPLSALRVGSLPYGVLPVTHTAKVQTPEGVLDQVRSFVNERLPEWAAAADADGVPRVSRDDTSEFLEVLAHLPLSNRFVARPLHQPGVLAARESADRSDFDKSLWDIREEVLAQLEKLGLYEQWGSAPRLARSAYSAHAYALCAPLVQHQPLSDTDSLAEDWLEELLQASHARLLDESAIDAGTVAEPSLLYVLLRAACLLEYANVAWWQDQAHTEERRLEPEIAFAADLPTNEPVDGTGRPRYGVRQHRIRQQHLDLDLDAPAPNGADDDTRHAYDELGELKQALAVLNRRPSAELERLLAGTLDCAASRLDAWVTSFASRRLATLRQDGLGGDLGEDGAGGDVGEDGSGGDLGDLGVHLGGWAWLENIRPAVDTGRGDFLHAAGVAAATTAGMLAHARFDHDADGLFDLDATSGPLADAGELLAAVRAGASLATVLGEDFERHLRDSGDDDVIAALRQVAPGDGSPPAHERSGPDPGAARYPCDGLAVVRRWRGDQFPALPYNEEVELPDRTVTFPYAAGALGEALVAVEARLAAAAAALHIEAALQTTNGNSDRAAAALAAAGRAGPPPAHLDVADMARRGVDVTHRVLVLANVSVNLAPAGSVGRLDDAAPAAAALAAGVLPDFAAIQLGIRWQQSDGEWGDWTEHTLAELDVTPLEVALAATDDPPGGDVVTDPDEPTDAAACPLAGLLVAACAVHTGRSTAIAHLALDRRAAPDGADVRDVWQLAAALRRTLARGRALHADDLAHPAADSGTAATPAEGADPTDPLHTRIQALADTVTSLAGEPPDPTQVSDRQGLRAALLGLAHCGLGRAVPTIDRLAADDLAGWAANALAAARYGPDALPAELIQARPLQVGNQDWEAFAASAALTGDDPDVARVWLEDAARVRRAVGDLERVLLLAEVVTGADQALAVAQHPAEPPWIAQPAGLARGGLSLVAATPAGLDPEKELGGLVLDEWSERIPADEVDTALALRSPLPTAAAPQAALLAVPPDDRGWTQETLEAIVGEAVDVLRARLVSPGETGGVNPQLGHLLPATLLLDADTNLRRLACDAE